MEELSCKVDCRLLTVASLLGAPIHKDVFLDPEVGEEDNEAIEDHRGVDGHKKECHCNRLNRVGISV